MNKKQAKKRIEKLKKEINHHRYLYHVLDKQEISDAALDSLKHELADLEDKYPGLKKPDSPTQRVGGKPLDKFKKVKHPQAILSIEDVFEFQKLVEWQKYMKDYLRKNYDLNISEKSFNYYCERKIDGVDIVLTYKKGVLQLAATRGNGKIGENVTKNVKTIEAVPLRLRENLDIVVRGEIFMSHKDFIDLNKKRKKQDKKVYANPRNLVAGSIRQLDPKVTAKRGLDCYAFEIVSNKKPKTHDKVHERLKTLGFKTDSETKKVDNLGQVKDYYQKQLKKRNKVDFDYDGVVIVLNDINLEKKLGRIGKSPRWMRAYKFPAEQATTQIKDINIQIGRTGALTPVAKLRPVKLMGSTVSRATLHNQDEIDRLDIRIGDTVIIEKAGDVIPAVVKVLKRLRNGKEKRFDIPSKCPFCNSKVKRKKGEAKHFCTNPNCFAQNLSYISYFVSKKAFDIDGFGKKIVEKFLNKGIIEEAYDIFSIKKGDIKNLEGFEEKSANNLIKAINDSKEITFPKFIQALNISHVGEETAIDLAKRFKSLEKLKNASLKELKSIYDIGGKVAQSIYNWFNNKKNKKFLNKMFENGVKIKYPKIKNKLKNKKFVLTGSLENLTRDEAKKKIVQLGGRVLSSLSKETDYLVLGKEPGSKLEKAKKENIKIIKEKKFLNLLKD
ncbi:MAG TPA: NAD-dependent DNA ligase LigA [Patescibacteria group bacterium]|nr:NAD-dependent DNA ligase LigA [Patescibacteria group bacterium]